MTTEDADAVDVQVDGMELEAAVDAVVEADESRDRTLVRDALEHVTEGGVVDASVVDESMAGLSRDLSGATDKARMASFELTKAQDAAKSVDDLRSVRARLDTYEHEVEVLNDRASDLQEHLQSITDRTGDDPVYAVAEEIRRASDEAESVQRTATELVGAIERFADWVESPEAWVNDLQGDLGAVEETLDAVEDHLEDLSTGVEGDGETPFDDPALVWYDATLRVRLVALMLDDVRVELSDLETLADRGEIEDEWYPRTVADELDELTDRHGAIEDRLDDLARPDWRDRFGERLDDFAARMDDFESPVDWTEIQAALEAYRVTDESAE